MYFAAVSVWLWACFRAVLGLQLKSAQLKRDWELARGLLARTALNRTFDHRSTVALITLNAH